MSFKIRQIRPDEGLRLRALRLHALADAPTAFGSTLAREEAFPEHVWHERAANGAAGGDNVTFIAEQDERWVGMAIGLAEAPGHSLTSGSTLVGLFVDGTARRCGVGLALVESVVAWARARRAACLALWVTPSNDAGIALYRRCGFQPTGAIRSVAGEAGIEMVRDLND